MSKGEEAKRRKEDATYSVLVLETKSNSRPVARRERAEKLRRASIGPERGDHLGRAEVFRLLAPPAATTETARGGGTAKRRARRSRGCYSFPARVAASRESRAGRPRVRRAPEAPAARRFPVPRTACAQDARAPYREVGWLVGSEGRKARIATARFGRCEARRKRERRKPLQAASEKVLRGSFRRKRRGLPNREPAAKTTANSQA